MKMFATYVSFKSLAQAGQIGREDATSNSGYSDMGMTSVGVTPRVTNSTMLAMSVLFTMPL